MAIITNTFYELLEGIRIFRVPNKCVNSHDHHKKASKTRQVKLKNNLLHKFMKYQKTSLTLFKLHVGVFEKYTRRHKVRTNIDFHKTF